MGTLTKKQHYIPQFFLKNFSIDNLEKSVYIYDVASQNEKTQIQNRKNIEKFCQKKYLYGKDNIIENFLNLSCKIENCLMCYFLRTITFMCIFFYSLLYPKQFYSLDKLILSCLYLFCRLGIDCRWIESFNDQPYRKYHFLYEYYKWKNRDLRFRTDAEHT